MQSVMCDVRMGTIPATWLKLSNRFSSTYSCDMMESLFSDDVIYCSGDSAYHYMFECPRLLLTNQVYKYNYSVSSDFMYISL